MFFENVMREDRSIMDFLMGDYTFVNKRLARHYGLEGVKGKSFSGFAQRHSTRRRSDPRECLTLTSNPTRTSR